MAGEPDIQHLESIFNENLGEDEFKTVCHPNPKSSPLTICALEVTLEGLEEFLEQLAEENDPNLAERACLP